MASNQTTILGVDGCNPYLQAVEGHRLTYMFKIRITSGLLQEQNCSSASVELVETAEVVLNRVLSGPMGQSTCTNHESQ